MSNPESLQTDWNICCLCQKKNKEKLRYVSNIKPHLIHHLDELSNNIYQFYSLGALPIPLNPKRLDDGDGIVTTLKNNNACYHISCKLLFSRQKLQRAQDKSVSKKRKSDLVCEATREKRKRYEKSDPTCFICEAKDGIQKLHNVETFNFCEKLRSFASELNETKLLKVVSCEDPIAQELKYHKKCYNTLSNRVRALRSMQEKEINETSENHAYPRAFAEVVTYIYEQKLMNSSNEPSVFKLSELASLYSQRLVQLGILIPIVNKTRFKDKLLNYVPELSDFLNGREVMLSFDKDVGPFISKACLYSDALLIEKTASLLRHEMLQCKSNFNGHFQKDYVDKCVPPQLMQFFDSSLTGVKLGREGKKVSDEFIALAHLFQFNCHKSYKADVSFHRHSAQRETAFPVYLGLSVYSKYRKESLVNLLFENGLRISYDRVLEISNAVGESVVKTFQKNGTVCPLNVKKGIFTTSAIDNIDHNPTAATAKSSFHGTSISLFQHSPSQGISQGNMTMETEKVKKISPLPDDYTNVKPAFFTEQPLPLLHTFPDLPSNIETLLQNQFIWLNKVIFTQDESVQITWSSHFSMFSRDKSFEVGISSLMPLLRDQAHDVATIKHSLEKIKTAVSFLNPTQSPVVTVDQPLFALAKQIQWTWPRDFEHFVIILGGLHIEITILKMIGRILSNSG